MSEPQIHHPPQDLQSETFIDKILAATPVAPGSAQVLDILDKAKELHGLNSEEVAVLMKISDPDRVEELYETARYIKDAIYGNRIVLFAPLYISNLCKNECLYCAFRATNKAIERRALTQEEIAREVALLEKQGHKRLLLVAGESCSQEGFRYILDSIDTVYRTCGGHDEIRRVNVNIAPLATEEFKELKGAGIGTYQLFQETYHRPTYAKVHIAGKKTDFDWRVTAMDRAMTAGIDDVGIGVLFGLHDWKFEILGLLNHIQHLEDRFGVGPHTISVPRLEPATNSELAAHPPCPVTDDAFRKIVAVLRLAVPYTGIILSTRESSEMRREMLALGISQISAGSRTNPGGYSSAVKDSVDAQFSLGDHRSLDQVIREAAAMGYVPSFCTACYRLGRTGKDFMDLAKPGEIRLHCEPNGLATFLEYLLDYASEETRRVGEETIREVVASLTGVERERSKKMLQQVREGRRDVYC